MLAEADNAAATVLTLYIQTAASAKGQLHVICTSAANRRPFQVRNGEHRMFADMAMKTGGTCALRWLKRLKKLRKHKLLHLVFDLKI